MKVFIGGSKNIRQLTLYMLTVIGKFTLIVEKRR